MVHYLTAAEWFQQFQIYIYIGIGIILMTAFILFQIFVLSRRRYKKALRELKSRYEMAHENLTNSCVNMINRLLLISEKNLLYVNIHEEYLNSYQEILTNSDKQCYITIDSLAEQIKDKSYKGMKQMIETIRLSFNDYEKQVRKLNENLSTLLKPDEDCRLLSIVEKEKFRSLKANFSEHEIELRSMENTFQLIFEGLEKKFVEFESELEGAEYDLAKNKILETRGILDALMQSSKELPLLLTIAEQVIPKRLQELLEETTKLEEEQYPLHHLQISNFIDNAKNKLKDFKLRLGEFRLRNIKKEEDELIDGIDELFRHFDEEKEAKIKFIDESEKTSTDTFELEKDFAKLKRFLPEYKSVYILDSKYGEIITLIQTDIDRMGSIKRDLDTFIHSSTKQPFSILLQKMRTLKMVLDKINVRLADFKGYLSSLKKDSEAAYRSISSTFKSLKEAEYQVRNANVPAFADCIHLRFEQAYVYLERINDILKIQPIDVHAVNDAYELSNIHSNALLKEVAETLTMCSLAENSIVYSNMFFSDYSEAQETIGRAKRAFLEGDFARSCDETVGIIKKMTQN